MEIIKSSIFRPTVLTEIGVSKITTSLCGEGLIKTSVRDGLIVMSKRVRWSDGILH